MITEPFKEGRVDPKSDGYVAGYKGKKEADSKMKNSWTDLFRTFSWSTSLQVCQNGSAHQNAVNLSAVQTLNNFNLSLFRLCHSHV